MQVLARYRWVSREEWPDTCRTIDWAVRGAITPKMVQDFIDGRIADLTEASAELCDLTDPANGIGMECEVKDYRRLL